MNLLHKPQLLSANGHYTNYHIMLNIIHFKHYFLWLFKENSIMNEYHTFLSISFESFKELKRTISLVLTLAPQLSLAYICNWWDFYINIIIQGNFHLICNSHYKINSIITPRFLHSNACKTTVISFLFWLILH